MAKTAKTPVPYVSINEKIATLEAARATALAELNSAPEDSKAALTTAVADMDRKIRWYEGRKTNAKFMAKEAARVLAASTPVAESTPESVVTTESVSTPTSAASLVNES